MFSSRGRLRERTGKYGTPRFEYLQTLVTEFQSAKDEGVKEVIAARLANFAYDPINFEFLRKLNVLELFLDCLTEENEKLIELGIGGICNAVADRDNAEMIVRCEGIPLIIMCLSSPVEKAVMSAMACLYYLSSGSGRSEILTPSVIGCMERYASEEESKNVNFRNLAKAFFTAHVNPKS